MTAQANLKDRDFLETSTLPEKPFAALRHLFKGMGARLTAAGIVFVIKHSPVWAAPIITAEIINIIAGGGPGAFTRVLGWALALFILVAQNIPTHTFYVRLLNGSIRAMEARTRMSLMRRLQELSFGFHEEARTGALQNKILRDVENVGIMVTQIINTLLATLVTIIIALVYTLSRKPIIALFFLLTIPIALALMRIFGSHIQANTQRYRKALEGMSVRVTEALEMLPITRAHANEDYEMARISDTMARVADSGRRLDILNGIFGASSWVMFQIFSLLSLVVSGYLALTGQIPIGDVVLYQGFFASIVGGVNAVINVIPDMNKGVNSLQSIGEVLRSPDLERNEGKAHIDSLSGGFEFEHVGFRYPGSNRDVLVDINLKVEPGKTIAFVGESGSGKSTIMNLVIGFHRPSSGRILLDGRDMETLDLRDFRRRLSVVSQNILLFSASIRDNVSYGMSDLSESQIRESLEAANAMRFIEELPDGLNTMLGEHGSKLSGGQRQRIAIARALIRDPRVLILDEATSALDVESERLVQEAINRVIAGRTTFIVAHRLSTIRDADAVAVLKKGEVVEFGTHAQLEAQNGEFAKLSRLYR